MALPGISIQATIHQDRAVVTLVERQWNGRRKWDRSVHRWEVPLPTDRSHGSSVQSNAKVIAAFLAENL